MNKDEKVKEAINNIIKETKCFNCIHAPICFAQKGGVDLQLASGMGCQYYQAKIADDEIVIKADIKCVDSTTAVNVIDFFAKRNAKVRQETAIEVSDKIYNKLTESDVWHDMKKIWWRHNNECYELKEILKQVLKELGVESED